MEQHGPESSETTSDPTPETTPEPTPTAPPPPPPVEEPAATGIAKADLGKRLAAVLIDGILAGIVGLVPVVGPIVGAAYMLLRDGLELDFMDQRSLGKKALKLRPVTLDGRNIDMAASIKRNIPFAIGPAIMIVPVLGWLLAPVVALIIGVIEIVLVLTDEQGRRLGDKLAETVVIEVDR